MYQTSIKLNKLSKFADNDCKNFILNNCSLEINRPGIVAIVGSSGAGKSSLLYCMSGLDKPSTGSVLLNNVDIYRLNDEKRSVFLRRNIGFVFQQYNLIPYLNVRDNILLTSVFERQKEDINKLHRLLDYFSIRDLEFEKITKLSGGEQQRVAICRSIYQNPSILFADEPTGALDSYNTKKVVSSLLNISRQGTLVVLVTHDPNIAEVANQIIFMSDGFVKDIQNSMSASAIQNRIKELSYA